MGSLCSIMATSKMTDQVWELMEGYKGKTLLLGMDGLDLFGRGDHEMGFFGNAKGMLAVEIDRRRKVGDEGEIGRKENFGDGGRRRTRNLGREI